MSPDALGELQALCAHHRNATALEEASHTVIAELRGARVISASIAPKLTPKRSCGRVLWVGHEDDETCLDIRHAGPMGLEMLGGELHATSRRDYDLDDDSVEILNLLWSLVPKSGPDADEHREGRRLASRARVQADLEREEVVNAVRAVAAELGKNRELDGARVREIMFEADCPPA
jgi:hypothetical protein